MAKQPLTVTVITDTHYYSKKLGTDGKAYEKGNSKSQLLLERAEEVLKAAFEQIKKAGGYDHNYAVYGYDGGLRPCACVSDGKSGISLKVYTTMPGMQFYTGNFIQSAVPGKNGAEYRPYSGLCVETQYFPNAVNSGAVPSPILNAGSVQSSVTVWEFGKIT